MTEQSDNLSLPYLQPAQAQKHVTHNEALKRLDLIVQAAVIDRDRTAPPAAPAPGDRHLVAAPAGGAWTGWEDSLAAWDGTAWSRIVPRPGWSLRCLAEARTLVWDGTAWTAEGGAGGTSGEVTGAALFGVNATADTDNRLAVASPAVLFSHDGAGHQVKVNKAGAPDTASLLFQTGFSGRAEMGTAGSDAFAIKVSPDGSTWTTACAFSPATGEMSGAAVQASATDGTAGRLMKTGAFGLGAAVLPGLSDADLLRGGGSGFYQAYADQNLPDGGAYAVLHIDRSPGTAGQMAHDISDNALYLRRYASGGWSDWNRVYTGANAVGAVSSSGGLPTGALVERGSSAQGDWVRHADGTQICWRGIAGLSCTAPVGTTGWYRTATASAWTYPVPFAAPPRVTATAEAAVDAVQGASLSGAPTASAAAIHLWGLQNAVGGLSLMAIGRWM